MAEPRLFPPMQAEDDMFDRLERERIRRRAARAQVRPEQVEQLSAIVRDHWWIPAGAAWSLAKAGVSEEAVRAVSRSSARQKSRRGWRDVGDQVIVRRGGVVGAIFEPGQQLRRPPPVSSVRNLHLGSAQPSGPLLPGMSLGEQPIPAPPPARRGLVGRLAGAAGDVVGTVGGAAQAAGEGVLGLGEDVGSAVVDPFTPPRTLPDPVAPGSGPPPGGTSPPNPIGRGYSETQNVATDLHEGAKYAARYASVLAESPMQELKALVRPTVLGKVPFTDDWIDAYSQSNSSTLRITLDQLLSGDTPDLGSGWLSGGEVKEQWRRESAALTFPGTDEPVTLGKAMTRHVFMPGTKPYNILSGTIDAAFELGADPTALALGGVGKAAQARKVIGARAGLIEATRPTVLTERVGEWLTSTEGRAILGKLADTDDFHTIWTATGRKFPVKTAAEIADASTADEVAAILRPQLGVEVREWPTFEVVHRPRSRLAGIMPGPAIPLDDPDDAVLQVERFLQNVKAPESTVRTFTNRMARAEDRAEVFQVVEDMMSDTAGVLVAHGLKRGRARQLTQMYRDSLESMRAYAIDEIGDNMAIPGVLVDGAGKPLPTPHLWVELTSEAVPLPNARDLRRATSLFRPILENRAYKVTESLLEFAQHSVWVPAQLIRGAWTVRVIAEEQLRMAASGLDSIFSGHPLSAIAHLIGRRGSTGLEGDVLDDAAREMGALYKDARASGWLAERAGRYKVRVSKRDDADTFLRAWAGELATLNADPVAQRVAKMRASLDEVKAAFWDGDLSWARKELVPKVPGLAQRNVADQYVTSVWQRIQVKTGSNDDLLNLVGDGNLGGHALRDGDTLNGRVVDALDGYFDSAPERVVGDLRLNAGEALGDKLNGAVNFAFTWLMTKPSNYLSRSPTFKQYYWQRAGEMLPLMTPDAQRAAIEAAQEAGLSRSTIAELRRFTRQGTGDLDLERADLVAKGWALDRTKHLLYDLTERGQAADASRLIFPFGAAWQEMTTRWAEIAVKHPKAIRRGQQIVEGARGAGFFYVNQNNEEVFNYPGTAFVSEKLLGVPVPLTGRVAGLSLMTEVLPGVGPVVQIPAAYFIPDKPEWQALREFFFPFGEPETKEGFVESLLPAWLKKVGSQALGFGRDDQQWENTVMAVAAYLLSTGEYRNDSPEAMRRLLDAAEEKAKGVYLIRGAAQFVAPSAPLPEYQVEDKDGNLHVAQMLVDEFRTLEEEDYDTAIGKFLDKYGEGVMLLMQGKSVPLSYGLPVSKKAERWVLDHPEVRENYPYVYGFFAPQEGDFDFGVYHRQFEHGERQQLTALQQNRLANHKMASWIYNQLKDELDAVLREAGRGQPTDEQRAWLRERRQELIKAYPGFQDLTGIPQRATVETLVSQLEDAVKDPAIRATDVGRATKIYLGFRRQALEAIEEGGLSPSALYNAKRAEPLRTWLREKADLIVEEIPDFAPVFDVVFSREMQDPADQPEDAAA